MMLANVLSLVVVCAVIPSDATASKWDSDCSTESELDLRWESDSSVEFSTLEEKLFHAIEFSLEKQIEKILNKKNARVDLTAENAEGCTPLLAVIRKVGDAEKNTDEQRKAEEIVKLLCQYGLDVNYKSKDGLSPLHEAIQTGNAEVVKTLCQYGADVREKAPDGSTLMHAAAHLQKSDVMRALFEKQKEIYKQTGKEVNIDKADKKGITPLFTALNNGCDGTAQFLLSCGCRTDIDFKGGEKSIKRSPLFAAISYAMFNGDKGKIVLSHLLRVMKSLGHIPGRDDMSTVRALIRDTYQNENGKKRERIEKIDNDLERISRGVFNKFSFLDKDIMRGITW